MQGEILDRLLQISKLEFRISNFEYVLEIRDSKLEISNPKYIQAKGDTVSHWFTQYRCFLPDLAGFSGSNCTAPQSLCAKRQAA